MPRLDVFTIFRIHLPETGYGVLEIDSPSSYLEPKRGLTSFEVLSDLFLTKGLPVYIQSDNDPEFIGKALDRWASGDTGLLLSRKAHRQCIYRVVQWDVPGRMPECPLVFIPPGCQKKIAYWREEYNMFRPHSSLGDLTPLEFAIWHADSDQKCAQLFLSPTGTNLV